MRPYSNRGSGSLSPRSLASALPQGPPYSLVNGGLAHTREAYRDLLIFEERLKQNSERLASQRRKYEGGHDSHEPPSRCHLLTVLHSLYNSDQYHGQSAHGTGNVLGLPSISSHAIQQPSSSHSSSPSSSSLTAYSSLLRPTSSCSMRL